MNHNIATFDLKKKYILKWVLIVAMNYNPFVTSLYYHFDQLMYFLNININFF